MKECNNALKYSGTRFFPGGFHLNLLSNCLKTRQGNVFRSVWRVCMWNLRLN